MKIQKKFAVIDHKNNKHALSDSGHINTKNRNIARINWKPTVQVWAMKLLELDFSEPIQPDELPKKW